MEEGEDVKDTAWSLATLVVAAIAIAAMLLWVTSLPATEVCLTKKEARQLWPRQHLYWYSKDHCWSNRRGPPRGLKFDPVFSKAHAEVKAAAPPVKIVKAEDFNELDAAADRDTFFDAKPFPYQQYVLNLDRYRDTSWHKQIWGLAKEGK